MNAAPVIYVLFASLVGAPANAPIYGLEYGSQTNRQAAMAAIRRRRRPTKRWAPVSCVPKVTTPSRVPLGRASQTLF